MAADKLLFTLRADHMNNSWDSQEISVNLCQSKMSVNSQYFFMISGIDYLEWNKPGSTSFFIWILLSNLSWLGRLKIQHT